MEIVKVSVSKQTNCKTIFNADRGEYQYAGYRYNDTYYTCICPCSGDREAICQ